MRVTCAKLFQIQHQQMKKVLIPLRKYFTERYYLNIFRIIAVIYHIYIGCEIYNFACIYKPCYFVEQDFINSTMGKWKDHYSFTRKCIYQGH